MKLNRRLPVLLMTAGLIGVGLWETSRATATQPQGESKVTGIASAKPITVNVILNTEPTDEVVANLARYGTVLDVISELDAVVMRTRETELAGIRSLQQVVSVTAETGATVAQAGALRNVHQIAGGRSTFNQDAINITDLGLGRTINENGDGVYVALIDSGLVPAWRSHLPKQQVSSGYARAFSDDDREGKDKGNGGTQAWENDPSSHATFLAGMILGFDVDDPAVSPGAQGPVEGTAPAATIIPIKITDDNEHSTASIVSRALVYATSLKERSLKRHPLVVCLAVVFATDEPIVRRAMDYAIDNGLIVVVCAGNDGEEGMGYPGAYPEAISVGASGWIGQWQPGDDGIGANFWRSDDVPDPTNPDDFFITDYSSRQLLGQYLDVIAPGHLIFGPGQLPGGPPDHFFGFGTSSSTPHVVGIVALMAQKRPQLTQAEAEELLKRTAVPIGPGCRTVMEPINITTAYPYTYCWSENATGAGLVNALAAVSATRSH